MAELAAAATIVNLLDFSGKALAAGYGFLAKVRRAPAELRMLLSDVANINALLDRVEYRALPMTPSDTKIKGALRLPTSTSIFITFGDCAPSRRQPRRSLKLAMLYVKSVPVNYANRSSGPVGAGLIWQPCHCTGIKTHSSRAAFPIVLPIPCLSPLSRSFQRPPGPTRPIQRN
jgi:hypothetical protein